MFNNLTKIVDIVKDEAQKIVNLDASMIATFNNFHLLEDKEQALNEYIEMLKVRKDTSEIEQVQAFLADMINSLNKHKVGMIDNYTHNKRIKSMRVQVNNDVKIIEEAPVTDKVEATVVETKPVETKNKQV